MTIPVLKMYTLYPLPASFSQPYSGINPGITVSSDGNLLIGPAAGASVDIVEIKTGRTRSFATTQFQNTVTGSKGGANAYYYNYGLVRNLGYNSVLVNSSTFSNSLPVAGGIDNFVMLYGNTSLVPNAGSAPWNSSYSPVPNSYYYPYTRGQDIAGRYINGKYVASELARQMSNYQTAFGTHTFSFTKVDGVGYQCPSVYYNGSLYGVSIADETLDYTPTGQVVDCGFQSGNSSTTSAASTGIGGVPYPFNVATRTYTRITGAPGSVAYSDLVGVLNLTPSDPTTYGAFTTFSGINFLSTNYTDIINLGGAPTIVPHQMAADQYAFAAMGFSTYNNLANPYNFRTALGSNFISTTVLPTRMADGSFAMAWTWGAEYNTQFASTGISQFSTPQVNIYHANGAVYNFGVKAPPSPNVLNPTYYTSIAFTQRPNPYLLWVDPAGVTFGIYQSDSPDNRMWLCVAGFKAGLLSSLGNFARFISTQGGN